MPFSENEQSDFVSFSPDKAKTAYIEAVFINGAADCDCPSPDGSRHVGCGAYNRALTTVPDLRPRLVVIGSLLKA